MNIINGLSELFRINWYEEKKINQVSDNRMETKMTIASELRPGADLTNANLTTADLTDLNLLGANLTNADLNGTYLIDVNLAGANLTNVDLRFAKLNHVNLQGANLTNAKLLHADLIGVDLQGTNLTNVDLRGANLTNTNLKGTIYENDIPIMINTSYLYILFAFYNSKIFCIYHNWNVILVYSAFKISICEIGTSKINIS